MYSKLCFKYDKRSSQHSECSSGGGKKKKEGIHSFWVFVTYSQCPIDDKVEFERSFSETLKRFAPQAKYFGCRERHEEEGIRYHVLVNLGFRPNWTVNRAGARFMVYGNVSPSLNSTTSGGAANKNRFIQNHVEYIKKYGDIFGTEFPVKAGGQKKESWREVGEQETKEKQTQSEVSGI